MKAVDFLGIDVDCNDESKSEIVLREMSQIYFLFPSTMNVERFSLLPF